MPLYVENKVSENMESFFRESLDSHSFTRSVSQTFIKESTKRKLDFAERVLYISQREYACISNTCNPCGYKWIASDDATTCHIVILINTETHSICLGHLDGYKTEECLHKMTKTLLQLCANKQCSNPEIEVNLFAGFLDRKGYSESLFTEILQFFISSAFRFTLQLCCAFKLNSKFDDIIDNYVPIITGAAVNIDTLEKIVCKCPIENRGPDRLLRHARTFTDGDRGIINIYDIESGCIIIRPFNFTAPRNALQLLSLRDSIYLQYCSTSPHCEPEHFVSESKRTIHFLLENPNPMKNLFINGKARMYRLTAEGSYVLQ